VVVTLLCGLLAGCGYGGGRCAISATVNPATATADHSLAPPGNQAQFSLKSSVSGNCPYVVDTLGTWSSSNPMSVPINSQGLATCQNGTVAVQVTISNSGTIRGHPFTPATLTCN
jgi:hypothetical protein